MNQTAIDATRNVARLTKAIDTKSNVNERRSIREFIPDFPVAFFQAFTIDHPDQVLGKHYHAKNEELFYFNNATGVIHTFPVDNDGKVCGDVTTHEIEPGDRLFIPTYTGHIFKLDAGSVFSCLASKVFDEEDNDLNKYTGLPDGFE